MRRWLVWIGGACDRGHAWLRTAFVPITLGLLLVTAICAFVPFEPAMPRPALDEAWALALNQAVAQGLVFGRDVIFTFGPYSFVFSKMYHPATDALMLVSSAYLAITYWLALVHVTRGANRWLGIALVVVLAGFMQQRDTLLLSYPMLVGVACCKHRPEGATKLRAWAVFLMFSSFGLLPLIKGSMLALCALVVPIAVARFVIERQRGLALCSLVAPVIGLVGFWVAIGQPVLALGEHLRALTSVIAGYAGAMAWQGDGNEALCYLAGSAVLLGAVAWDRRTPGAARFTLVCVFGAFLFVAFKAGLVRHDSHALICAGALLVAAVVACGSVALRLKPAVLLVAIVTWGFIDGHHLDTTPAKLGASVHGTYASTWHGIEKRLWGHKSLDDDYAATLSFIRETRGIPMLDGTTDVYSYGQTELIASGNRWNPRPILQSYSVYTAFLDERNREHLAGASAPDNILFRVEAIDNRLPALEDGASWPLLLASYQPHAFYGDMLHLRRRVTPELPEIELISTSVHRLGERVAVPRDDAFIVAELAIEPSLFGSLAALVFKPGLLSIAIEYEGGRRQTYRLVAAMARQGFLLSPSVETTDEVASLYSGTTALAAKRVRTFRVTSSGKRSWGRNYRVTFKRMKPVLAPPIQGR
jgi:hypothetical protein